MPLVVYFICADDGDKIREGAVCTSTGDPLAPGAWPLGRVAEYNVCGSAALVSPPTRSKLRVFPQRATYLCLRHHPQLALLPMHSPRTRSTQHAGQNILLDFHNVQISSREKRGGYAKGCIGYGYGAVESMRRSSCGDGGPTFGALVMTMGDWTLPVPASARLSQRAPAACAPPPPAAPSSRAALPAASRSPA